MGQNGRGILSMHYGRWNQGISAASLREWLCFCRGMLLSMKLAHYSLQDYWLGFIFFQPLCCCTIVSQRASYHWKLRSRRFLSSCTERTLNCTRMVSTKGLECLSPWNRVGICGSSKQYCFYSHRSFPLRWHSKQL